MAVSQNSLENHHFFSVFPHNQFPFLQRSLYEETGKKEESPAPEKKKLAKKNSTTERIYEEDLISEPCLEVCQKIAEQVEFYFSDANLANDNFLLKHIKKSRTGGVSLKLVSSFRGVKKLTRNHQAVAFAVEKCSQKLQLNSDKTRVHRIEGALPDRAKIIVSRTVLALNLSPKQASVDGVKEIFSQFGSIAIVRILRPGNPIPPDVAQHLINRHYVGHVTCALVEFDTDESTRKATKTTNILEGMKVVQLDDNMEAMKEPIVPDENKIIEKDCHKSRTVKLNPNAPSFKSPLTQKSQNVRCR